jgi:PAS domain S-box-containing protein
MNLEYNIFSIALLISGLAAFFMSVMVFQRMGGAVRWFGFTMTLIAVWAITYGFELSSSTLDQMLFWINLEYIGIALLPAIWIIFIIKFIGKDKWLTRVNTILLCTPAVLTLLFVWTNSWHHLHYSSVAVDTTGPFPLLKFERGIWYWIHTFYFYILLFWGLCLMISKFRKADAVYRKQNNVILIGALGPWLINLIYLMGIRPFSYIDLTPYAFIITTLVIGFGLLRLKLFDIVPLAREKILEDMQEGVLVLDSRDRVIDLNREIKKNLSVYASEILGANITDILPNEKRLHDIISRRSNDKVEIRLHPDDSRIFEINVTSLFEKNTVYSGVILLFRDITDQKIAEEKLREQANQLSGLNQLKDRLFSIISHDLRSPLLSLMEIIEMTDEGMVSEEEFKSFLPHLSKNIGYTSGLLENLLSWSKSQLGGETVNPVSFDLKNVIKNKISIFEKKTTEKGIDLSESIKTHTMVFADKDMIMLVLRNLIANAIKFCSKRDKISISAEQDDHTITVCVTDTGIGIKSENIEKLFGLTAFTTRGTDNEQGTGLGLLLCKDFIEKNNGKIWVESTLGEGSKFYFQVPKPATINE